MYASISVDTDVDVWEVLDSLTAKDREAVWFSLSQEFGPKPLEDPVTRLELITELRRQGYTVEPA